MNIAEFYTKKINFRYSTYFYPKLLIIFTHKMNYVVY